MPEPTGWLTNIPLTANGGSNYLWEPTNIVSDSNGVDVNIYPKTIYDLVTLSGNDANGCYESDTVRMSIDFVAPRKSFSPNGDAKVEFVSFDMFPTSHLFKKGHKIQIRLAGVDTYNFKNLYPNGGAWEIHHDEKHPTHIELPVVDRKLIMGQR